MALSRRRLTRYLFAGLYGAIIAVTVAGWWWDVVEAESAAAVLFVALGGAAVVGWIMLSEHRRAAQAQRWDTLFASIRAAAERDKARKAMNEPTMTLPTFARARPTDNADWVDDDGLYRRATILDEGPLAAVDAYLAERTGDIPRPPRRGSSFGSTTPRYLAQRQTPGGAGIPRSQAG